MKIGDIAARIGTYTSGGQEKGRYVTVGSLMQGADGSYFGSIHSYIDLAQLHQMQRADDRARGRELRDTIAMTVFASSGTSVGIAPATPTAAPAAGFADLEEVPF
jgi:hypothetical protein